MSNLVTVLMTTYNEMPEVLMASIDSILAQTYTAFDFLIIVDNPNNQEVIDTIREYMRKDRRIRMLINETNLGLPMALNRGIDASETKYIARMDADDIAVSNRLERQIQFLQENPNTDLVGANVYIMDYDGTPLYPKGNIPTGSKHIAKVMRYANVFNHPTFVGKTDVFKKFKYRNLRYSQDYDLTCRLMENGCLIDNVPERLLHYRRVKAINPDKLVRQKITYFCVQKCYRNKSLTKTDIEALVEKEFLSVDKEKLRKGIDDYNDAFDALKMKRYGSFLTNMVKSFCSTKQMRYQIICLARYAGLKIKNKLIG